MFKIPDWGDDVPKTNVDLKKLLPGKNKLKAKNKQAKVNLNTKVPKNKQKNIVNGKVIKVKNKNKRNNNKKLLEKPLPVVKNDVNKKEKQPTLNSIDVKNYDTDKLDEVILDAKKKKLVDSYMKEDNEETLFNESSESNTVKNVTSLNSNNINDNNKSSPPKKLTNVREQKKQLLMQAKNNSNNKKGITKRTNNANIEKGAQNERKKRKNTTQVNVKQETEITKNIIAKNNVDVKDNKTNKQFSNNVTNMKINRKKELLRDMLQNQRNHINVSNTSNKLRERMLEKLNAAKFRFLNEKLYTSSGSEAQKLFQEDPAAFHTYHQGYQQQVKKWPVNPLDVVVRKIKSMPKTHLIADMGCGEAALSKRVPHSVRSFDLVATAPGVEVCDMAHTPLLSDSMNVVVYCLALMGTDLTQYLVEANRVLKMGGHLLIAEVESRFDDVDSFVKEVQKLGFTLRKVDKSHQVFYFMEFTKAREAPSKKSKLPALYLKPCIYKKR